MMRMEKEEVKMEMVIKEEIMIRKNQIKILKQRNNKKMEMQTKNKKMMVKRDKEASRAPWGETP